MSNESHERWREEAAAYALGALEPSEAAELERHLAGCEQCRRDLRWLDPAVASLAESVERLEPPARLRRELLETVQEEVGGSRMGATAGKRRRFGGLLLRPAIGVAAVALIVAVGVIAYSAGGGGSGTTTTRSGQSSGVAATLERSGDSGTLELSGLGQLPSGKVYQAWVQHSGGLEPSSLFAVRRDGTASAAIPRDLEGARRVLVTVEPRGGSTRPTSPPLVSVATGS